MDRFFLITVDTEGDNLWAWHKGDPINTTNTRFIPRFQELCNKFGFKPVYLTNYEMLMDDEYCVMVKDWQDKGLCEIALHLHAWNTPPHYKLDSKYHGNPYLIEYPNDIMHAKFKVLYDLFIEKFGFKPFSHRAGRWAMDERYFSILKEFEIRVDCSYTPGVDWSNNMGETCGGSNYLYVDKQAHKVGGILEIPVTIRFARHALSGNWKHRIKTLLKGDCLQLRPATNNIDQMKMLVNIVNKEDNVDYLEFMIHSSELMPDGSPYFKDSEDIEREFDVMEKLFSYAYEKGYRGVTLKEYYKRKQMNQSRTNIIASNTLFLYLRSFVTMIIGVYTSRVLLSTLGVDDYGVYNLVGGIVTMFASLKTIFASAIQRFLNYEKGTGITERVQMVFNTGLIVQFILAFVFCIVVEVIGMWFIANKLNIPEKSISDAYFVFHLSVATAVLAILTAPFDATIIANEKMKVFAWLSMINSILKLIIVFSLPIIGGDYLRVYALLLLLVTVFDITFNIWYTRRFPECKIRFRLDKTMFKNIASFSGWVFLGNSAFSAVNEGINFMLNIFGGVAYNASRAIAYQLKSAISTLSANITVVSRPYIVQQSAINDKQHTYLQICKLSRLVFMVMALTVFPFIIFADTILRVWLVEPPIMSTLFVQLVLIHLLVRSLHEPIDTLFKSFGEIKYYQIFDSLTLALTLPISYAVLKMGAPIYSVFIVIIIVEVITLSILLVLIKKQFRLSMQYYLRNVFSLCLQATILFSIIGLVFYLFMPDNIYFRLVFFLLFCLIEIIAAYILLLDNSERQLVVSVLKRMK